MARSRSFHGAITCMGLLLCGTAAAQISPPGMGLAHTASWLAVGIRQDLDTLKREQWMAYVGVGRKSDPNDLLPYHRQAILVLNQEYYHRVHPHWQYALALSYRQQDEYRKSEPYEHADPYMRQELRIYGRWSYLLERRAWKFAATFRQELRMYYTPDLIPWKEDLQLRTRLRASSAWSLNAERTLRLRLSAEALFAMSHLTGPMPSWSPLRYTESRFCLFLSKRIRPLILSVGYMNNLLGRTATHDVHYLAMSAVWENPFTWHHR